ncbi:MAG: hypothetical protein R2711_12875 [Acidimicrobiales bacterium]
MILPRSSSGRAPWRSWSSGACCTRRVPCSSPSTGRSCRRVFGYHEVWRAFGVAAGAVLFAANLGLVRGG